MAAAVVACIRWISWLIAWISSACWRPPRHGEAIENRAQLVAEEDGIGEEGGLETGDDADEVEDDDDADDDGLDNDSDDEDDEDEEDEEDEAQDEYPIGPPPWRRSSTSGQQDKTKGRRR